MSEQVYKDIISGFLKSAKHVRSYIVLKNFTARLIRDEPVFSVEEIINIGSFISTVPIDIINESYIDLINIHNNKKKLKSNYIFTLHERLKAYSLKYRNMYYNDLKLSRRFLIFEDYRFTFSLNMFWTLLYSYDPNLHLNLSDNLKRTLLKEYAIRLIDIQPEFNEKQLINHGKFLNDVSCFSTASFLNAICDLIPNRISLGQEDPHFKYITDIHLRGIKLHSDYYTWYNKIYTDKEFQEELDIE